MSGSLLHTEEEETLRGGRGPFVYMVIIWYLFISLIPETAVMLFLFLLSLR